MTTHRVLVDDVRDFKDGREAVVFRGSSEAVGYVRSLGTRVIDELWLDHDLTGDDTVQPLVDLLVERARSGAAVRVRQIWVHSANPRAGHRVLTELQQAGYPARRSFVANMWRHAW